MMPCSECHIGQMQADQVTYFTWLDEDLITVPDFPSWKCDICGHLEYDLEALNNLALLLCPVETKTTYSSANQSTPHQDQPQLPQQPSTSK
ncbi:MAG: YgiT-type zinc finger protein [Anaerolineales bacterium]|nr:MAG: YgiT-type zinc finger protein [Anaerolineales bacterium]